MEEKPFHFFTPDEISQLARVEEAARANEYLYRVLDIGQYMLQCGGEVSRVEDRQRCLSAVSACPLGRNVPMYLPLPPVSWSQSMPTTLAR